MSEVQLTMIHSLKKLLKSNYLFTLGILICLGWILAAVLAPVVAPYDPIAQDLSLRLKAPSAKEVSKSQNDNGHNRDQGISKGMF